MYGFDSNDDLHLLRAATADRGRKYATDDAALLYPCADQEHAGLIQARLIQAGLIQAQTQVGLIAAELVTAVCPGVSP